MPSESRKRSQERNQREPGGEGVSREKAPGVREERVSRREHPSCEGVWFGKKCPHGENWALMTSVRKGHLRDSRGQKQWGEEQRRWVLALMGSADGSGLAGLKL